LGFFGELDVELWLLAKKTVLVGVLDLRLLVWRKKLGGLSEVVEIVVGSLAGHRRKGEAMRCVHHGRWPKE